MSSSCNNKSPWSGYNNLPVEHTGQQLQHPTPRPLLHDQNDQLDVSQWGGCQTNNQTLLLILLIFVLFYIIHQNRKPF